MAKFAVFNTGPVGKEKEIAIILDKIVCVSQPEVSTRESQVTIITAEASQNIYVNHSFEHVLRVIRSHSVEN